MDRDTGLWVGLLVVVLAALGAYLYFNGGLPFAVYLLGGSDNVYFTPENCASLPCSKTFTIGVNKDDLVQTAVIEVGSQVSSFTSIGSYDYGPVTCNNVYVGGIGFCDTRSEQNKYCVQQGYWVVGAAVGDYTHGGDTCIRYHVYTEGLTDVLITGTDLTGLQAPFSQQTDVSGSLNSQCVAATADCEAKFTVTSSSYGTLAVRLVSWEVTRKPCANCAPEEQTGGMPEPMPPIQPPEDNTPPLPPQSVPGSTDSTWLIVVIGILVLAAGGYLVYRSLM